MDRELLEFRNYSNFNNGKQHIVNLSVCEFHINEIRLLMYCSSENVRRLPNGDKQVITMGPFPQTVSDNGCDDAHPLGLS